MTSAKHQAPNSKEAPSPKRQVVFAALDNRYRSLQSYAQAEFKKGAGTASSPCLVSGTAFYGDEPSPPLRAQFLDHTLSNARQWHLGIAVLDFSGAWRLEFGI